MSLMAMDTRTGMPESMVGYKSVSKTVSRETGEALYSPLWHASLLGQNGNLCRMKVPIRCGWAYDGMSTIKARDGEWYPAGVHVCETIDDALAMMPAPEGTGHRRRYAVVKVYARGPLASGWQYSLSGRSVHRCSVWKEIIILEEVDTCNVTGEMERTRTGSANCSLEQP